MRVVGLAVVKGAGERAGGERAEGMGAGEREMRMRWGKGRKGLERRCL